jgi:AcrR family transcriptional regulator
MYFRQGGTVMAKKEDLRVKKTKKGLYEALMALLSEKTFDAITVRELCDTANIRRATFYKHYDDKFAFLTAFTHALRDRFDTLIYKTDESYHTAKYYVAYAKRIVEYITEHEAAVNNLMNSTLFPMMLTIIIEQNYADTLERLNESVVGGMKLGVATDTTTALCVGGVATAIYLWVRGGKQKPADKFAEEIGALISNILK